MTFREHNTHNSHVLSAFFASVELTPVQVFVADNGEYFLIGSERLQMRQLQSNDRYILFVTLYSVQSHSAPAINAQHCWCAKPNTGIPS